MAKTPRQQDEPTRSRRVRAVVAPLGRASAAVTACILWVGLALPGLQLLPGAGGFGDRSIAISLQSALLGIDDGYVSTPEVRAAMRALGLSVINQSSSALRSDGAVSLPVEVDESVRADTVDAIPVAVGPHDRTGAGTGSDAPGRETPEPSSPQPSPLDPVQPNQPTSPPGGGGGAPSKPTPVPPPVPKSAQSITFTSSPLGAVVGGAYTVGASASSGLPVSFSLAPGSSGVCTISGATVSFVGSGSCTIRANQAGNGSYLAAPQVTQSVDVDVAIAVQTISFTSSPPKSARVGDSDYHVSAKATSGLSVEFGAESNSAGICKVTGAKVHLISEGTCTINATQRGNSKFHPAPPAFQSFSIGADAPSQSIQSINFTSTPPSGAVVGGTAYTVSASSSSGLPVSFSIDSSSAGVCTLSGATVSFVGAGTCTIRADQSGNASYQAAPAVSQSFAVNVAGQTISFTSSPPGGAGTGGPTYSVTAAASSGLAVTFSSGSPSVCNVSGSTVSFLSPGTCTVLANQAGNGSYSAAPQVSQSFAVAPGPQTITFTSAPPSGAYVGGPTYTVAATASSGLAVTFSSDSPSVCSVTGSTVSFAGTGTCIVRANQSGNASYQPAPQVQQSFTVVPPPSAQTITFTSSAPSNAVYLGPSYNVSATASSGLPVTFTVSGTCTVSGSTVAMTGGAGTCTVYANQSGSSAYQPAPQVQQTFSIGKAAQTITFPDPGNHDKNDPPFPLSATSTSGLAVTYTLDPSSASICSLSGNMVTPLGERGDCIVYANQAGDANYLAAPQVTQVIDIKNHTPGP